MRSVKACFLEAILRLGVVSIGLVVAGWFLTSSPGATAGQITAIETPGNLKPTHDLDCISVGEVKNEYTPPDMMVAWEKCARAGRYEDAWVLWLIAGTYDWFDTLRVTDTSSHDAFQVLMVNYPVDPNHTSELRAIAEKFRAHNSPEMRKFCSDLKSLGPPNYYPGYMVSHGMGAFFGSSSDGLARDFDAKKAWKDSLDKYMHCDVTDMP